MSASQGESRQVRMTVRDAPMTWKGIAQAAAVSLASIAQALFAIADALDRSPVVSQNLQSADLRAKPPREAIVFDHLKKGDRQP